MKLSLETRGKKGTWWAVGYANGRRIRQSLGTADRDTADMRLLRLQETLVAGVKPDPGMTVGRWLDRWITDLEADGRAPATIMRYRLLTQTYFKPYLGDIRLDKLEVPDVTAMDRALLQGGGPSGKPLKASTVANAHNILSSALHEAQRQGLILRNVASLARRPRQRSLEAHWLPQGDVLALLAGARQHPWGPYVAVAALTGLRASELCGLRWDDIDLGARVMHVRHQWARASDGGHKESVLKTEASRRDVPLSEVAADWLQAIWDRQAEQASLLAIEASPWVFAHRRRGKWRPYTGAYASQAVGGVYRLVGLPVPDRPIHILRHTVGSLLAEAEHDLKLRMALLGHADPAVAAKYAHATDKAKRRAMNAVGQALEKREG